MDELRSVLFEILVELKEVNSNLTDLKGSGLSSMDDVCNKLDSITMELYNMRGEYDNDLGDIKSTLSSIDFNTI